MNTYSLQCCGCGKIFVGTCERVDVFDRPCPACHAQNSKIHREPVEPPTSRRRSSRACTGWGVRHGVSYAMPPVKPQERAEMVRHVPSAEFDSRGRFVFHSDSHQRRVYREIAQAQARHQERNAP